MLFLDLASSFAYILSFFDSPIHLFIFLKKFYLLFFLVSDEDECAKKTYSCHVNATCSNTIGSYKCMCFSGLQGDGRTHCTGKETPFASEFSGHYACAIVEMNLTPTTTNGFNATFE